ncbi:MAG: hypothetical protein IT378_20490 [Sandaracinaceae bacterium]|nr:hypothetical protein [Sandaracinaceae bacterium]
MTYAISVPTPFADITELAESFASRVDEERLMLPNAEPIPEGEWVQFAVTLGDGSAALSGLGRCTGSYDNGEDRAAEHRFDIVLDALQLDEMAQIYFERILIVRGQQGGEEPRTGEVELPAEEALDSVEAAPIDEPSEPPADASAFVSDAVAYDEAPDEAATYAAAAPYEEPQAPAPAPAAARAPAALPAYPASPPVAPGQLPSPHSVAAVLTRPIVQPSWSPEPLPRPDPRPSSGLFQYPANVLPFPNEPPRPQLDPSLQVRRAPRPGDVVEMPFQPAAAPVAEYEAEAEGSFGGDETMQVDMGEDEAY